jgi:hypothetical protein
MMTADALMWADEALGAVNLHALRRHGAHRVRHG